MNLARQQAASKATPENRQRASERSETRPGGAAAPVCRSGTTSSFVLSSGGCPARGRRASTSCVSYADARHRLAAIKFPCDVPRPACLQSYSPHPLQFVGPPELQPQGSSDLCIHKLMSHPICIFAGGAGEDGEVVRAGGRAYLPKPAGRPMSLPACCRGLLIGRGKAASMSFTTMKRRGLPRRRPTDTRHRAPPPRRPAASRLQQCAPRDPALAS